MNTIREKNRARIQALRAKRRARIIRCLVLALCLCSVIAAGMILRSRNLRTADAAETGAQDPAVVEAAVTPAVAQKETETEEDQPAGWTFYDGDGTWMYFLEDGSYQTGWMSENGRWYYFNEEGAMETGWTEVEGKWYFFRPGGSMVTGWLKDNGYWFYLNPGGSMATGWKQIGGDWYYFNAKGQMATGWLELDGKWYYMQSSGRMTTGWAEISGRRYHFTAGGKMTTGWLESDGKWYYMRESGSMATGWVQVNEKWYYLGTDGVMVTGQQTINGKKYYFRDNGSMYTGWRTVGSDEYYYAKDGSMQTGYVYDDGEWFYMNSDGRRNKSNKILYLTFDDGPGKYTEKLLGTLKKYGVRVTFFVTAQYSKYLPLIEDEAKAGHVVALHTYSHTFSEIYASTTAYWKDFEKMQDVIVKYTGKRTNLVRFPGGSSNKVSRICPGIMTTLTKQMGQKGYYYFDWNVDSNDAGGTTTASGIVSNLKSRVKSSGGSVILCHDVKSYTVDAMDTFIPWALNNGYIFLPLSEKAPGAHHRVNN
ncbi:MAG: polysaccharide deacetylase family protein [Lachnospiraceae bacterium]|nr:polysaccharide deacetylase family protein [Lachnospiraceae bacterium]